jgi:poly-gamma-glutamate capsule biosynthesis protein CapA/YwtB (metallophosphatase superfamily)
MHNAPQGTRLLFTGDIMLSRQVAVEMQRRKVSPWMYFGELFRSAQWVSGNLEGAIGTPAECLQAARPCFATPESSAALLKNGGFTGVTFENNHAGDLGSSGRERTRRLLLQGSLAPIDFEHSPYFLQLGDWKIALIAMSVIPAADGLVQRIPSVEVAKKLQIARRTADFVVISIHWGKEYQRLTDATQRQEAQWLVRQGADLIVGHHPHVIEPPQCVDGHPVFFSLGNFVFDQTYPPTKEGLIADCRLNAGRLACQGIRTHTGYRTSFPRLDSIDPAIHSALAPCALQRY